MAEFDLNVFWWPAESLPRHTAGDYSDGVEVSVGNEVPEHPQEVTDTIRVDVSPIKLGVDEVREANNGVEEVTEGEMEHEDDGVQLEDRELETILPPSVR